MWTGAASEFFFFIESFPIRTALIQNHKAVFITHSLLQLNPKWKQSDWERGVEQEEEELEESKQANTLWPSALHSSWMDARPVFLTMNTSVEYRPVYLQTPLSLIITKPLGSTAKSQLHHHQAWKSKTSAPLKHSVCLTGHPTYLSTLQLLTRLSLHPVSTGYHLHPSCHVSILDDFKDLRKTSNSQPGLQSILLEVWKIIMSWPTDISEILSTALGSKDKHQLLLMASIQCLLTHTISGAFFLPSSLPPFTDSYIDSWSSFKSQLTYPFQVGTTSDLSAYLTPCFWVLPRFDVGDSGKSLLLLGPWDQWKWGPCLLWLNML